MYPDYLAVICDVICNTSEKSSTRTWGSCSFIAEAEHEGDPVPFGYETRSEQESPVSFGRRK